MKDLSDEQLVGLYLTGNEEALETLIRRYFKRVFNFTARYIGSAKEAEDLTQEVFMKVWQGLRKFDQNRNFQTWMWRIVRNICVDYLRRKKPIAFSALENDKDGEQLSDKIADTGESIIEEINKKELAREMQEHLAKLSGHSREIILLRYGQRMTFKEIAELLGEPIDTVKSRSRRALLFLRKRIAGGKMHQKGPSTRIYRYEGQKDQF
ncbi:MAG: sigma-70 family RNA polymerase sigma factor [Candidatus Portnoybacteria bacterium]|nr:sigma-70 family RNA polymerase sigma factor [Candidatus Portnoybacteria bacterium]MDD4983026.1 sigma-70 family RNA polymerase sigma factor [Candidatus Portnoybacteria bacterium]